MGSFATPSEVKARVKATAVQELENADLDDLFVVPAERLIEERHELNLDTNGVPWHYRGIFQARPDLETRYRADYKMAVIHLVRRMAQNPHGYGSQSVQGASVDYGRNIPPIVGTLMNRWGQGSSMQGEVFR